MIRVPRVALIPPARKLDYLADTVIDGLLCLREAGEVETAFCSPAYPSGHPDFSSALLTPRAFLEFAKQADIVVTVGGKEGNQNALLEKLNRWDHLVFVDGSEVGKNRRFDPAVQSAVEQGSWNEFGKIHRDMLDRCALYFRREKPYLPGIRPFPFGIESRYNHYSTSVQKDIDFVCVFGQELYPPLRKEVRLLLEAHCRKNGLVLASERTESRDAFYDLLARSKVGISVGGGGFDTARFWEILGNNCYLLTETIDIYEAGSTALAFDRILSFSNAIQFQAVLEKMTHFLKTEYRQERLAPEFSAILDRHSATARVREILRSAEEKGLLRG